MTLPQRKNKQFIYFICVCIKDLNKIIISYCKNELQSLNENLHNQGTLNRGSVGWQMSIRFSCFKSTVGILKINISYYQKGPFLVGTHL